MGPESASRHRRRDEIRIGADHRVAALAARQRGLVTRSQLLDAGLTAREIRTRRESGRLHDLHPGVYAAGHPGLAPEASEQAALLWAGRDAALSHRTAAMVWGLLPGRSGAIHVTISGRHRRAPGGIVLHQVAELPPSSLRRSHGLTLTDPARTLHDLAALGDADDLARALNEALVRRLVTIRQLQPRPKARGAALLRAILADGPTPTRSAAERRLLRIVRDAGLPPPETNVRVGPYEVDALWRDARLVVEVDGFAAHGTRAAFERDRRRDADLQAAGYAVMRVTWRGLTDAPLALVARLAPALRPPSSPRATPRTARARRS